MVCSYTLEDDGRHSYCIMNVHIIVNNSEIKVCMATGVCSIFFEGGGDLLVDLIFRETVIYFTYFELFTIWKLYLRVMLLIWIRFNIYPGIINILRKYERPYKNMIYVFGLQLIYFSYSICMYLTTSQTQNWKWRFLNSEWWNEILTIF